MATTNVPEPPQLRLTTVVLDSNAIRRERLIQALVAAGYSVVMSGGLNREATRRCVELAPAFVFAGASRPLAPYRDRDRASRGALRYDGRCGVVAAR